MENLRDCVTFKMVDYFKVMITDLSKDDVYRNANNIALRNGYYFDESVCGYDNERFIVEYIDSKHINTESTFYKTWADMVDKSRFEIFLDQLQHYASTYGTNFEGTPFIPNDYIKNEDELHQLQTYTYIKGVSEDIMERLCYDVLTKNVALDSELVQDVCNYITNYLKIKGFSWTNHQLNFIKNKEAKRKLRVLLNIKPENGQELFEYIYYVLTGDTLVIKNKLSKLKVNNGVRKDDSVVINLTDNDMKLLAEVFYRYKPLFLMMKTDKTKTIINKIRKYANTYHKPLKKGVWDNIVEYVKKSTLKEDILKDALIADVKNLSSFKIITIMQGLFVKAMKLNKEDQYSLYRIRNGKSFLKKDTKKVSFDDSSAVALINTLLFRELGRRLESKKCIYKLPEYLTLVCPTSEKNFIGEIPMGSSIKLENTNNYVGIYWRNEWGTRDYDLSVITDDGEKVGWNGEYCTNGMMYSGDMTTADPEATEIVYSEGKMTDSNVYVNRYCGEAGSKFRMFYGNENIEDFDVNYMVSPETIKLQAEFAPEQNSMMIGRILNNTLYFVNMTNGNGHVSGDQRDGLTSAMNNQLKCYIPLDIILRSAGFEKYDPQKHDHIDLDLSDPDKKKILDLFV